MGIPVIFTPTALDDLRGIVSFIAVDSPNRAKQFGYLLVERAMSLSAFPEMGHVTPEIDDSAVREILEGSYRIIYELKRGPSVIYILRFWHAARGEPDVSK